MSTLSYVNVFARDIEALSGFYRELFGFRNIPEIASPIFRGLDTGKSCIGFNAPEAYELLQLDAFADALGARLIKAPYETYYHWYQAVLLDPEDNVFRINHML
ncbi:Glyoxalase-like domain [Streptococcus pneumoniae]|nr:Glyoxalase-like domain [Streptococcus pneumoniae]